MDAASAIAFLQKTQAGDGASVYEHLARVLAKVLEDKPDGTLDLLETSYLVKKTAFDPKESSPLVPISSAADAAKVVATVNLFGNPDLPIDPETGEPIEAETPNDYEGEDIVGDGFMFDAIGAGLGRQEMYNVALAAKKLGEDPKRSVATVRFFGKFFGLFADYYVFETTLKDPPEIPEAPEGEVPYENGAGTNAFVYFVCNHLGGPMTQLPFVKPDEIKAARLIKKFLTGRLASHVSTYPLFPGNEANYLRAQIARIAATTVCAPSGLFMAGDDGSLEKNEDFGGFTGREYITTANWVHRNPHLKKQGRCELYKREPPEGEEDTWEPSEEEQEEGPELLASLEDDKPMPGEAPSWTPLVSSTSEAVKFQVGGLRSNLWPGAFVVGQDRRFSNMYVGWGVKNAPFVPLPPPPVAKEYDQALVESLELPPKPAPPAEGEDEEAEE